MDSYLPHGMFWVIVLSSAALGALVAIAVMALTRQQDQNQEEKGADSSPADDQPETSAPLSTDAGSGDGDVTKVEIAGLGTAAHLQALPIDDLLTGTHDGFLRRVVDADPNLIFVKDRNGRFVFVNRAMAAAYGHHPEQMTGKFEKDIIPEARNYDRFAEDDRQVLNEGRPKVILDDELVYRDGSRHWFKTLKIPLLDDKQQPYAILGIAVNITEQKRARDQIMQEAHAAERGAQLKSSYLATMSHEIRTPLNSVIGFSELLLKDAPTDPAEVTEYLEIINANGRHLLRLINSVLDFSKLESDQIEVECEPYEFRRMMGEVTDMFSAQLQQKQVDMELNIDSQIPLMLDGDEQKLQQVLINLLGNAVKFTNEGRITLSAHMVAKDEDAVHISFTVSDTGIGIPEDKVATVFESFAQVKAGDRRLKEGTGLGLAISKRLVDILGGELVCESRIDEGTTFAFTISEDISADQTAATLSHDESLELLAPESSEIGLRVLIVDDDPNNAKLTQQMVERFGCEAHILENGSQVVPELETNRYDLVFMDLAMPEVNGLEATRRVRERFGKTRGPFIVALTAAATGEDRRKSLETGMNFYLAKPVALHQIRSCLNTVRTLSSTST